MRNKWTGYQRFKRQLIHSLPTNVKKISLAIIASVFIGTIFGFISLYLAKQDMKVAGPVTSNAVTNGKQANETDEGSQQELEAVSLYMVQAGVFSDKANADTVTKSFQNKQFPAVSWEFDGQYYVFTGIGSSEAAAKDIATQMIDKELEVYVKEWTIEEKKLSLTEKELAFIVNFLTSWKESLEENKAGENVIDQDDIKPETDIFASFYEKINTINNQKEAISAQQWLLNSIYAYETLGK